MSVTKNMCFNPLRGLIHTVQLNYLQYLSLLIHFFKHLNPLILYCTGTHFFLIVMFLHTDTYAQPQEAGDVRPTGNVRQEMWDRRHEAVRRSETDRRHKEDISCETDRIHEADRRRMPGDVRQEDRERQENWERQETWDRRPENDRRREKDRKLEKGRIH